jgi:natural product biosynthesis luciferase-like monooxygenase protein
LEFGIFFFPSNDQQTDEDKYLLLKSATQFADEMGFRSVWTPERHFHAFGGLFPNPSVISAALAMITRKIQIRAGSLISPLHHVVRIAEEWAVVDNLSHGRVAISFGSGWNVDDFVFFPERYATRQAVMYEQIETVRALWRGETITLTNSFGKPVNISLVPKPVQRELDIWVTSSGNVETFTSAGARGANVLTHLMGQDIQTLAGRIQAYRSARERNGFDPDSGKVSLMLHTFLGADVEEVKRTVREPLQGYLRSAIKLERQATLGGGVISGGHQLADEQISERDMADLLELAFEKYFYSGALLGTPSSCREMVWRLKGIGVDEIACLIDFGLPTGVVMKGLDYLNVLRASFEPEALAKKQSEGVSQFMESLDE